MKEDRAAQEFKDKEEKIKFFGILGDYLDFHLKDEKLCLNASSISQGHVYAEQFEFKMLPPSVEYFLEDIYGFGDFLMKSLSLDNV